jgi:hypothetical protein
MVPGLARDTIARMTDPTTPLVEAALRVQTSHPDLSIDEIAAAAATAEVLSPPSESADVIARIARALHDRRHDQ